MGTATALLGRSSSSSSVPGPPPSARTHLKQLHDFVNTHHECVPCQEYHRDFWLPPEPDGKQRPTHPDVKQHVAKFATKQNDWGHRPTDLRTAGWYIENHWALQKLQRSESSPAIADGPPPVKQPWTKSNGVTSCMVGGNGGGLNNRNVGLYEDSFPFHPHGQYRPPAHGLNSTAIGQMGDAFVMQKAM